MHTNPDITTMIGHRPTWAEVNLENLVFNFNQIKRRVSPKTKILATVKADAYGHGLIPVSRSLEYCGADYFGVASVDEGIALREAGITAPILVLGLILKNDIEPFFTYRLTPTVCSIEMARAFNTIARSRKQPINVHIKVDTGMGRVGVLYDEALSCIRKIFRLEYVYIEGIFTHLACADINENFTGRQIDLLDKIIAQLDQEGLHILLVHVSNSLGVLNYKKGHFQMVRPGLVLYGIYPEVDLSIRLKPVLSLKTRVIYVKHVPRGSGISYGHTYVTAKRTVIATLPIGYGDGYPRNLSNIGPVLINGKLFRISGRICMDQIMVDVGNFPVKIGDEVVLIGSQGKQSITAEQLADLAGTIPYEIVCGLGSRIPRIYTHAHNF